MINLSNTTPAAPAHTVNVTWQTDATGSTSAYVPTVQTKTTIAPVAGVLIIDVALGNSFLITVNAAITSATIYNPTEGQEITLLWQQDGTGHSIVLPTNLLGATAPTTTAYKVTCQRFTYNLGDDNWFATSAGVTNM